jgi:hypothetical protein
MVSPRHMPPLSAREPASAFPDWLTDFMARAEDGLALPYRGITTAAGIEPGLFPITRSGVSTDAMRTAARAFLGTLSESETQRVRFPIVSDVWRRWNNMHPYVMRHGLCLEDMTEAQCRRALDLVASAFSDEGFAAARDVMRLNETLREITESDAEYGEWLYWISIMGEPSETEPWGFQLDGHHLIVNCFVLGDQVVATPYFLGSEPVLAETGKYKGTRVFALEEQTALELAQALSPSQYEKALLGLETPREIFTTCYRDNFELNYEGIAFGDLNEPQQRQLLDLVSCHISQFNSGHSAVKLEEIRRHLDETFFAWMGGNDDESVFYYRIHSPVVLIEFDHEAGVALDNDEPTRNHIHSIIRTPNGNDYGMDLLRQHYERDHAASAH